MHIVTKILAVFGAILSVLLAALTIAYSANADRLTDAVRNEQAQKFAAEAALKTEQASRGAENAALLKARDNAETTLASAQAANANLQQERTSLMVQLQEARLQKQSNEDTATSLSATVKANQALIEALTKEISELRNERLASARREAELVDRLNDLESQRQVLEQSTRALQEQLAESKLALDSGGKDAAATNQPYTFTGPLIQARIVSVTPSPTGDLMAEISAGSGAGLKPNMKLNVVRDGKFVANLIITNVDVQRAVGRIDKLNRAVAINDGDLVLSRLD